MEPCRAGRGNLLAQHLIGQYGDGVGKIQARASLIMGMRMHLSRYFFAQPLGQTGGLLAEHERRALRKNQPRHTPAEPSSWQGTEAYRRCGQNTRQGFRTPRYRQDTSNPARSASPPCRMSKPSGFIRCSRAPVAAQVRAMAPVLCGISGSTSTMSSIWRAPRIVTSLSYIFSDFKVILPQKSEKIMYF